MKLKFCFSAEWKSPTIPLVVNEEFFKLRTAEYRVCLELLDKEIKAINLNDSRVGNGDLYTAYKVSYQLRLYRAELDASYKSFKGWKAKDTRTSEGINTTARPMQ